jgi:hypothetical protein
MKKTDPNTPAFARATDNPNLIGLTKREYFAAFALQGLLASGKEEYVAPELAVQAADQLVAELGSTSDKAGPLGGLQVFKNQTVIQVNQKK